MRVHLGGTLARYLPEVPPSPFKGPLLPFLFLASMIVVQVAALSVTDSEMRPGTILGAGCTSAAAAAEQQPLLRSYRDLSVQNIAQGISPDARPSIDGLLFMSVTKPFSKV
jgi:hypothetical protein